MKEVIFSVILRTSMVTQTVKTSPAMQDTQVQSLGWEDPLENGIVPHSSILVWRIPWIVEPGGYSPWGSKVLDTTEQLTISLSKLGTVDWGPRQNL